MAHPGLWIGELAEALRCRGLAHGKGLLRRRLGLRHFGVVVGSIQIAARRGGQGLRGRGGREGGAMRLRRPGMVVGDLGVKWMLRKRDGRGAGCGRWRQGGGDGRGISKDGRGGHQQRWFGATLARTSLGRRGAQLLLLLLTKKSKTRGRANYRGSRQELGRQGLRKPSLYGVGGLVKRAPEEINGIGIERQQPQVNCPAVPGWCG
jgi:hypothetical protein